MEAKELMTTDVITVSPDTHVDQIARILLDHKISAVPVIDSSGAPIGMVSEGDLIGRSDTERDARRDWWLDILAKDELPNPETLTALHPSQNVAKTVMATPVITVTESTDAAEIARLLAAHRIKRVPVVRDGHVVGIVSRADLLQALEPTKAPDSPAKPTGWFSEVLNGIDRHFLHPVHRPSGSQHRAPAEARGDQNVNAVDFRTLVSDFKHDQADRQESKRRAAVERRKARVKDLIDHHVGNEKWQALLHKAREAAEHGKKEAMLLRFPSQLCSDGGRAINVPDPEWPKTLRGEAAEIYLRWEHDLKPHGFHLEARILEFPGGYPGDIGLFLVWGE